MFCPQCGTTQSDESKFCKLCGANLSAVRQAAATRETGGIDWSKTWVAEMFLSGEEKRYRQAELERLRGITPEVKRVREIKAGVITSFAGLGVALFLFVLMEGIVRGGGVTPDEAEIVSRIWVAGLIPVFVGIALIINGVFVSRKLVKIAGQEAQAGPNTLGGHAPPSALRSADTNEFVPSNFSVTEETTMHLKSPGPKP